MMTTALAISESFPQEHNRSESDKSTCTDIQYPVLSTVALFFYSPTLVSNDWLTAGKHLP